MTKRQLFGFVAVTALILSAATPSFARGGGHGGGHGGHGGHRGGHAAAHVARGGHAHSFAHAGGHAHHNAHVAHAAGRHVGANHSFAHGYAHGYAGGNRYGWNHGGWNRGYGYAGTGRWGRGWGYGYPGYWGRRSGLWNVGYFGGVGPGYLPYAYGVSDPTYAYQYYNNVTVPMAYPSITKLTPVDGANTIEPGALTVPPAPADPAVEVSDSSVLDSTIPAQASSDLASTR